MRTIPTLTALRAELSAADPLRPAVARMPRAEVEFLLTKIAAGGALWTANDDQPALPLTRVASGRAHKARGTYPRMNDDSITAFLAAEAA